MSASSAFKPPRSDNVDTSANIVILSNSETDLTSETASVTTPLENSTSNHWAELKEVPLDFDKSSATDLLSVKVPSHVLHRWQLISPTCKISDLFGTNAKANVALRDIKLQMLLNLTGETEFSKMSAKTGFKDPPRLGLTEIFARRKIQGRCARCRSKGLMFFYMMCAYPEDIQFPEFNPSNAGGKRKRATPFSLAETGRLVAILADSSNRSIVSMLFQKLKRADIDAKAGAKGPAFYWNKIAKLFNDAKYVPPVCDQFIDHVEACGTSSVYSTAFVPENRTADNLRNQWSTLRANFAVFQQKYTRSGMNEPDPTKCTNDLDKLLMHFTFKDTPDLAWAAKSNMHGMDDAGDGNVKHKGSGGRTRTSKKQKGSFGADKFLAGARMCESICNVSGENMTPQELQQHKVRMQHAFEIMDMCLSQMKCEFGL